MQFLNLKQVKITITQSAPKNSEVFVLDLLMFISEGNRYPTEHHPLHKLKHKLTGI